MGAKNGNAWTGSRGERTSLVKKASVCHALGREIALKRGSKADQERRQKNCREDITDERSRSKSAGRVQPRLQRNGCPCSDPEGGKVAGEHTGD